MFMNFIDYSDDINLFMLTKEQCYKVRLFVNIYRNKFLYFFYNLRNYKLFLIILVFLYQSPSFHSVLLIRHVYIDN